MAGATKKKFNVVDAYGNSVEVEATRVESDESGVAINFFNGDDLVASFRGYNSFSPVSS